ncbi:MAG: magnesium transporter, partial [Clostridia bacterium]|nr:magnesium transporter [Clostridia bacterium]
MRKKGGIREVKERILEVLAENNYAEAAAVLSDIPVAEVAQLLGELSPEYLIPLCRELESDFLADVLVEMEPELQQKIIEGLHDDELNEVMEEVSPQDTAEIIEELPQKTALKITEEDEISVLFHDRKFATLKPLLASMNENDLAEVFESLPDEELPLLFRLLPKDLAPETFVEMDSDVQEKLLNKLTDKELGAVMDELFIDDVVDLVEEMPSNVVKRVLAQSDAETRNYVNEILKYPKDSAGSIMTVEFVAFSPDMTVADAFAKIRKTAIDKETIYTCYVIDSTNKLMGMVSAKDLMLADEKVTIRSIMEENVIYSHTLDDQEAVARKLAEYGFIAIPIVDEEKRLVGIVTVDDAMDVLQEENTEDIAKMAATLPSDKPYLKTSVWAIWRNRIPWLLVLLVSATFTGLIINNFEASLSAISVGLIACMTMIMD